MDTIKVACPIIYDEVGTPIAVVLQIDDHRVIYTLNEASEDEIVELLNNLAKDYGKKDDKKAS